MAMYRLNVVLALVLIAIVALNVLPRHKIQSRWLPMRSASAPLDCGHGMTDHYAVKLKQGYTYESHKAFIATKFDLDTVVYTRYHAGEGTVYGALLNGTALDAVRADHGVSYLECVEGPASESAS